MRLTPSLVYVGPKPNPYVSTAFSLASNFGKDDYGDDLCSPSERAAVVAALCEMLKVNQSLTNIK